MKWRTQHSRKLPLQLLRPAKQIRLPAPKPNDFLIAAVVLSYVKYLILSSATRCYDPHQLRTKLNTAFRAAVEQSECGSVRGSRFLPPRMSRFDNLHYAPTTKP